MLFDSVFAPQYAPQYMHTRTPAAPAQPRVSPVVETHEHGDEYLVTIRAPEGFALAKQSAEPLQDGRSILVEGVITARGPQQQMCEYIARARAGVYAEPTKHALVGFIPTGTVVRGSAPSSGGWIALDDDESFVRDDGALVARAPPVAASAPFSKRIQLARDANLSRATLELGLPTALPGEVGKWRVVFKGGRVAVRAGTHTSATILGAVSNGDVVQGIVDDVDPNWIRLLDARGKGVGYVMIEHPMHGVLLAPLHDRQRAAPGAFCVHVPRRPQPTPACKRPAPASQAAAPAPTPPAPPPTAARAPAPLHERNEPATRAEVAAARRAEKRSKGDAHGGLPPTTGAVLSECPASPENVQRPSERVDSWMAVEGGGFVPVAVA